MMVEMATNGNGQVTVIMIITHKLSSYSRVCVCVCVVRYIIFFKRLPLFFKDLFLNISMHTALDVLRTRQCNLLLRLQIISTYTRAVEFRFNILLILIIYRSVAASKTDLIVETIRYFLQIMNAINTRSSLTRDINFRTTATRVV